MPKRKAKYGKYYSEEAHTERLNELLNWAKSNEEITNCLKRENKMKATKLLREEGIRRFGVRSYVANEYAEIIYAKLKTQRPLYTKYGYLE